MAKKNIRYELMDLPYELYQQTTRGGAMVLKIFSGKYEGYSFTQPSSMLRGNQSLTGFSFSYPIEQELAPNGDVINELPRPMFLKKNELIDGKFVVVDEIEIDTKDLPKYLY
jgi:hypothetical protein